MEYKYETHLHTSGASLCGAASGAELVKLYRELGYQGLVVTNHFFNGNCGVARELPWEEKVKEYYRSYELTKEAGDRVGLDVFFGIEWAYQGDEFLLYGVTKEWLFSYPDMLRWSHRQLFEEINKIGGLMIQAHPFRDRGYITRINLYPELVHGVEVTNSGNRAMEDRIAKEYADKLGLSITSGSDTHDAFVPTRGMRGVISDCRWEDISTYIRQVKSGSGYRIISSEDAGGLMEGDVIAKDVSMADGEERDITHRLKDILPKSILQEYV